MAQPIGDSSFINSPPSITFDANPFAFSRNPSIPRRLPSVAKRFSNMDSTDLLGAGEVGDGAGDAQHPVEAARGQAHRRGGIGEQLAAGLIRGCDLIEQLAICLGVRARTLP